jgi:D-glycero-alpha-D-manno-heptose-7-phosphate kinase
MTGAAYAVNARSPLRIDFVGMTDHIGFCREFGGDLINATINKYIYAAACWRDDGRIILRAPDQGDLTVEIAAAADLDSSGKLGLAQEVLRRFDVSRGLEVVTYSEMPGGAGLGSSSTIATCLIAVLDALTGYRMTAYEMAETARDCEASALRTIYGWQDQYSPVTGGGVKFMRHWPAATGRGIEVDHVNLSSGTMANLERGLVVAFSGISRPAKSILDHAWEAVAQHDQRVIGIFQSMNVLAGEIRRMLAEGRLNDLGPALAEVWRLHKAVHPDVTNERLDQLYDIALAQGATGGKCCGAGGGGTMLFYAPPGRDYAVRQALREADAQVFDISLDMHGLLIW